MLSFVQSNILILLHPFIPFFTEKVWQDFKYTNYFKKSLMFKSWDIKSKQSFNKSYRKIDWLIDLVTNIRSTKVDLNVSPGSFIDISTSELDPKKATLIKPTPTEDKSAEKTEEAGEASDKQEDQKK